MGYALVDTAGCLIFSLVTTLLQKYYTDILHLGPLFIMLMFMGARIWDAINDPIMGRIADTAKPGKFGRYRPWLLYAAAPLALSGVLMFVKFPGMGEEDHLVGTAIYATCTYILFGMIYTVLQIPYGSLASVVTTDDGERNKLSVFRSIGAALGSIPVLFGLMALILFVWYPLSRQRVAALQQEKERTLKESYEKNLIHIG